MNVAPFHHDYPSPADPCQTQNEQHLSAIAVGLITPRLRQFTQAQTSSDRSKYIRSAILIGG
jgi:hypothetical protein